MSSVQAQPLSVHQLDLPLAPIIRIRRSSPDCLSLPTIPEVPVDTPNFIKPAVTRGLPIRRGRVERRETLRRQTKTPSALPIHMVKEVLQTKISKEQKLEKQRTEKLREKSPKMAPHQQRSCSLSSRSSSPEASPTEPPRARRSKSKSKSKDIDWSDVTDPEERRRIQNRIAQRKFREKTRENKEKAEREARNQQYAGNSYRIPTAEDFMNDAESDGLPWGGLNFGHAVLRGHESEGRRSSGRGTYVADEPLQTQPPALAPLPAPTPAPAFMLPYTQSLGQGAQSFGRSGAEDIFMEDASYRFGPAIQPFPHMPTH